MNIFEGLFSAIVVVGFFFWMISRLRGKSALEQYNDMMDAMFGLNDYEDIGKIGEGKLKNPFKSFKNLKVADYNVGKKTIGKPFK